MATLAPPSPYRLPARQPFDPQQHDAGLRQVIAMLRQEDARDSNGRLDRNALSRVLRQHPKPDGRVFSKAEIIQGFRYLASREGWEDEAEFVALLRMKPVRTLSGVAPVTVLTKPFPCPGRCIFCPNDVRMPKSYLSREPGAQRAAQHSFDPYGQTLGRLLAFHHTGHHVDKVELIILGGTWSFYPEQYQIWFVKRCFDAMNDFASVREAVDRDGAASALPPTRQAVDFAELEQDVDGRNLEHSYNQVVSKFLGEQLGGSLLEEDESCTWDELEAAQLRNEDANSRCVGLVVETRPDRLDPEEAQRIRRLGATKVQIGIQSLDDEVLKVNRRGHDVAATQRAMELLRQAGFKLQAHWMPNLHGSDPDKDPEDFRRLFTDPSICPDELKIYPCSLLPSAELMQVYEAGQWRPYSHDELLKVLSSCLLAVPPYCRVTRVIRDIPGDEIPVGNRTTNFRQVVEQDLARRGLASRDIRQREVRSGSVRAEDLRLETLEYRTHQGRELFLQLLTSDDRLAGFCRLALPERAVFLEEIAHSAMIREVHVYGAVVALGKQRSGRAQHAGSGRRLVRAAARRAAAAGYGDLAVISSVGTRHYYRRLGFVDGKLYQHLDLESSDPEG